MRFTIPWHCRSLICVDQVSSYQQPLFNFLQVSADVADLDASLIFEQDPVQIIDALLPLYLKTAPFYDLYR